MKSSTATGLGKVKNVVLKIVGYLCAFSGVCVSIASIAGDDMPIASGIMGMILCFIGVACLVGQERSARLLADFRKYNAILANDPVKTIYRIAEMTGETAEAVRAKVNRMIEKGFFVNAYIDQSGKIALADRGKMDEVVGNNDDRTDFVTVTCPACGGVNRLAKGQVGKCEFCGAYISDKA